MPLVSCICPTFNKFPKSADLVAEAVESFLRQTMTDAELLVGNDCPQQQLAYYGADPRVRIVNFGSRFSSLGAKLNAMTDMTDSEWICRWDDDDISLPNRLQWSLRQLEQAGALYVAPRRFWAKAKDVMSFDYGAFSTCMYSRRAWLDVGKYSDISFTEDQRLEQAIGKIQQPSGRPSVIRPDVMPDVATYIYRWDTGSEHLSGHGKPNDNLNYGWNVIGAQRAVAGTFEIVPKWNEDYVALVRCRSDRLMLDKAAGA